MKQYQKTFLIVLIGLLFLGVAGYFINNAQQKGDVDSQLGAQQGEQSTTEDKVEAENGTEPTRIGGQKDEHGCLLAAGYGWCPSTGKCQRMWEEYCEEYQEQFKGEQQQILDDEAISEEMSAGDVGENPPEYTKDWQVFTSEEENFKFQYPENYETVIDKYGWPYSIVHLISKEGGQSYDVTFEVWEDEKQAADEGRMANANAFFGMVENPFTEKFVSMTCWNQGTQQDCEDIYATLIMQE